jgi:radical SAM protein with 4Fe4S-binding SPASM domain
MAVKSTEAPHFRRIAIQRASGARGPGGALRRALDARTAEVLAGAPRRPSGPRPPLDINAGRGFAFIDHQGTVYPSGFLPAPVGSIRQSRFSEIYRESALFKSLRDPGQFEGRCGRCEFHEVCGGSRSQAYAATGDPLGDDPMCTHLPAVAAAGEAPR